jgi:hypothetical protein
VLGEEGVQFVLANTCVDRDLFFFPAQVQCAGPEFPLQFCRVGAEEDGMFAFGLFAISTLFEFVELIGNRFGPSGSLAGSLNPKACVSMGAE